MSQEILNRIHARGYWKVAISPSKYKENRITSLKTCKDLVVDATIKLRGWDYPHSDTKSIISGQNFVECFSEFWDNKEFWRFYQSGQFVNHFAMREDWQSVVGTVFGHKQAELGFKGLEIVNTIYRLTEIIAFASKLATKNIFEDDVDIIIELFDTENRKLFFWESGRDLTYDYACSMPEIVISESFQVDYLLNNSAKISMDIALSVFEKFNWKTSAEMFKEEQEKFLKGFR